MYISPGHSLTWDAEGSAALLFGGADDAGHRNDAGLTQCAPTLGTVGVSKGLSQASWGRLLGKLAGGALLPNPARAWGARLGGLVDFARLVPRLRSAALRELQATTCMHAAVCCLVITPTGNDLHALHIVVGGEGVSPEAEAWEWRNPLCTGAPPPAREMHAAALLGRTLLLHGGRGGPHAAAALQLRVNCRP